MERRQRIIRLTEQIMVERNQIEAHLKQIKKNHYGGYYSRPFKDLQSRRDTLASRWWKLRKML